MPYSPDTSISTGVYHSSRCGRRTETFVVRRSWLFLPPQPAPLSISLAHHIASSRSGSRSQWCPWPGSRKTHLLHQPFVISRRTVDVKADRSACHDFLGGDHSANHQSVAEQHPAHRLQYAKHLDQFSDSPRNMAQNVARKRRVKRLVGKREILRSVAVQPFFRLSTLTITEALPSSSCLLLA
jgi:hypothetical protein